MFDTLLTVPTGLASVIALCVGFFLKQNPKIKNAVIPWVTFVVSVLTQILQNLDVPPADAATLSTMGPLVAINFAAFGSWILKVVVNAAIQTAFVTGAHSAPKNGIRIFD